MWRTTGDIKWREWLGSYAIFQAIESQTRVRNMAIQLLMATARTSHTCPVSSLYSSRFNRRCWDPQASIWRRQSHQFRQVGLRRLRGYPADRTQSPVERVIIIGRFNSGNRGRILWRWCHGERGPNTTENPFTHWFLDKRHSSCGCGTLDACQPYRTPNFRDVCFRSMFKLNHRTETTARNSFRHSEISTGQSEHACCGHPDVGVAGDGI